MRRIFIVLMSVFIAVTMSQGNARAIERVVVNSLLSDKWYDNVYLLADKVNWMTFRNFTVQIGDKGQLLYHFPKWESGKYNTFLFRDDLDGNKYTDVITVLDNYKDPIHVLHQEMEPNQRYREVTVEKVEDAYKRLVKVVKQGNVVTIDTKQKTYKVNINSYHYTTVKPSSTEVFLGIDQVEYSIVKHKIVADAPVLITIGGLIGYLKLTYDWDGTGYVVKSASFKQYTPHQYD